MSGHKLDRFKRAFGGGSSDELITLRDGKVKTALGLADAAIRRVTDKGLDASAMQRRRDTVEANRDRATKLGPNKAKSDALEVAKEAARALAGELAGEADTLLAGLDDNLKAERKRLATAVTGAKALKQGVCKTAVAGVLKPVEDGLADAELKANDSARLTAMRQIDSQALAGQLRAAKKIEGDLMALPKIAQSAQGSLDKLPDGQFKTDRGLELKAATDEIAALPLVTDFAELARRADAACTTANDVSTKAYQELNRHNKRQTELAALRTSIGLLVDPAKKMQNESAKAVVKDALDTVENAVAAADRLGDDQAKIDALKQIDLKPLRAANVAANDLGAGIPALLQGLSEMIGKLPDGKKKTSAVETLLDLTKEATRLQSEADIDTARSGYSDLRADANALMDGLIQGRGKDGYRDAMKARFGIDVTSDTLAQVNIQSAYEMLDLVPASHVGHDKLTKLHFQAAPAGGGDYLDGRIRMQGTLPRPVMQLGELIVTGEVGYTVDGQRVKPNAFNVTMLHEIGHAVDDKNSIMDGVMEKAGYGSWKKESKDTVKAALANEAVVRVGAGGDGIKGDITKAIEEALGGKEPKRPNAITSQQWKKVQEITKIAIAVTEDKSPWFNASPDSVVVGGRIYVEAYANDWFSYAKAERDNSSVGKYQWRSPSEWFADLYGILWMTKKKPPQGVGADIAPWLPQ